VLQINSSQSESVFEENLVAVDSETASKNRLIAVVRPTPRTDSQLHGDKKRGVISLHPL
jgi:hypothetical protein